MTTVHLFAGTAGVGKRDALTSLARRVASAAQIPDSSAEHYVKVYDVHDFQNFSDVSTFLGMHTSAQRRVLRDAWESLHEAIVKDRPAVALVSFHGTFYRDHQVRLVQPWAGISRLKPVSITVLIDDVYHMWKRIEMKNEEDDSFSHYSLAELLSWRTLEYEFASCIARDLYPDRAINVWLFAVKHYIDTLYKLLFSPEVPRCYLSFPITKIRGDADARSVIDTMRESVSRVVTAFDPLTIDEMILVAAHNKLVEHGDEESDIQIDGAGRWPLDRPAERLNVFPSSIPIVIPRGMVRDLLGSPHRARTPIEDMVRSRDFVLCTQGQFLAIYRPSYMTQLSVGATAEAHFTTYAEPRRKLTYWPREDGPRTPAFFADFGVLFDDEERWFAAVSSFTP